MRTINDRRPSGAARTPHPAAGVSHTARRAAVALAASAALVLAAGCGGETATFHRDVRLELAHDPPGAAPAGAPLLLGLRVSADPPLQPGSAHLWYDVGAGWERIPLEPLPGTDRWEARVPPQSRGRTVRYFFAVKTPLGETVRLPERRPPSPAEASRPEVRPESAPGAVSGTPPETPATAARDVYELSIRAPILPWAAWLRGAGALVALLLVAGGATLAARWRPFDTPGRSAGVILAAGGAALFVAAMAGAVIASFQATGNALRDVPGGWWVALAAWLPILVVARVLGRRPAGSAKRARRLALLAAVLGVAGAVGLLLGLGRLL
jgi:hypothetical protein